MQLQGKTVLITGGGRGVGRALALICADEGADVAVVSRTQPEVEEVAAEIRRKGRRALPVVTDITNEESVQQMVSKVLTEFQYIDILINNAGVGATKRVPIVESLLSDWENIMNVNLKGVFLCTREVLKGMIARKSGNILNISSRSGVTASPNGVPYSVSKWGLEGFTKGVAEEVKPYNIRVNSLSPGRVITQNFPERPGENRSTFRKPEDIREAALYLLTDASHPLTGTYLHAGEYDAAHGIR